MSSGLLGSSSVGSNATGTRPEDRGCGMHKATVIAAAGCGREAANIIAATECSRLFGIAQSLPGGVTVHWHRAIFEDGANERVSIISWLAGHDELTPHLQEIASLLSGPSVDFVRPGDYFDVDPKLISAIDGPSCSSNVPFNNTHAILSNDKAASRFRSRERRWAWTRFTCYPSSSHV